MCRGRKEGAANDCRCGTHEFKAFQNDFFLSFLPSSAPVRSILASALSLSRPCLCIGNSPGGRKQGTRWFCLFFRCTLVPEAGNQTMLWKKIRKATYIPPIPPSSSATCVGGFGFFHCRSWEEKKGEEKRGEGGGEEMRVVTGGSECLVNSNWPPPPPEGACRHQFQPRQT